MPSPEELEEQELVFFQKILELRTYLMDTRKIQGDIAVISYRYNSGIDVSHEQVQRKERLKMELKEKTDELRRNHHLSPGQVEGRLRQYEYEVNKIERQVTSLFPGCYREDIQDAGQQQAPPEIHGAKGKLEERYERESEQAYKYGQEKQCGDNHSETINRQPINRQPRQKDNYDRLRKLYEDGGPQHPAPERGGAGNHDFEIPDSGHWPRKGYTP